MYRFLMLISLLGLLLACKPVAAPTVEPGVGAIPFETLSLNDSGVNIRTSDLTAETQLLLLTSVAQALAVEAMVNPEDFIRLQEVDYERYAVIGLFRGMQGSSNYQTVIQALSRENGQLIVKAELWAPNPSYYLSTTAETYPYHLIQIAKADLPSSTVVLQLDPIFVTPTPPAK